MPASRLMPHYAFSHRLSLSNTRHVSVTSPLNFIALHAIAATGGNDIDAERRGRHRAGAGDGSLRSLMPASPAMPTALPRRARRLFAVTSGIAGVSYDFGTIELSLLYRAATIIDFHAVMLAYAAFAERRAHAAAAQSITL